MRLVCPKVLARRTSGSPAESLDRSSVMSEAIAVDTAPWMLVAGQPPKTTCNGRGALLKRPVLLAVARRGLPNLLEATIVPAVLFFVIVTTIGAAVAMAAVLVWGYGAILRRVLRAEPIPAILMLATLGLTIKTLVGLLSGSTFAVLPPAGRDHRGARRGVSRFGADRSPGHRPSRTRLLSDRP